MTFTAILKRFFSIKGSVLMQIRGPFPKEIKTPLGRLAFSSGEKLFWIERFGIVNILLIAMQ